MIFDGQHGMVALPTACGPPPSEELSDAETDAVAQLLAEVLASWWHQAHRSSSGSTGQEDVEPPSKNAHGMVGACPRLTEPDALRNSPNP